MKTGKLLAINGISNYIVIILLTIINHIHPNGHKTTFFLFLPSTQKNLTVLETRSALKKMYFKARFSKLWCRNVLWVYPIFSTNSVIIHMALENFNIEILYYIIIIKKVILNVFSINRYHNICKNKS